MGVGSRVFSAIADSRAVSVEPSRSTTEMASVVKERLYVRGDEFFIDLVRDINAAVREVYLETYIFELDPVGRAVIAALSHAHQRGVKVRLLVDGVGLPLAGAFACGAGGGWISVPDIPPDSVVFPPLAAYGRRADGVGAISATVDPDQQPKSPEGVHHRPKNRLDR